MESCSDVCESSLKEMGEVKESSTVGVPVIEDATSTSDSVTVPYAIPSNENFLVFMTFVVLGNSALSFCTFLFFVSEILPGMMQLWWFPFSNSLIAVYCTFSLVATAVLIVWFPGLRLKNIFITSILFSFCSIAFPLTCTIVRSAPGSVLLHLLCCMGGALTAVFQSNLFAAASVLPRNYMGAASLGLGLNGLLGFAGWIFITQCLFSTRVLKGLLGAMWVHSLFVSAASNIVGLVMLRRALKLPWVERAIRFAENKQETPANEDTIFPAFMETTRSAESESKPSLTPVSVWSSWWSSFCRYRGALEQIFNVSLTLFITLLMYPAVAPSAWRRDDFERSLLIGTFLTGDFLGRYLPNLRHWCPRLTVRRSFVKYLALLRLGFIPLLLYPAKRWGYSENDTTGTFEQSFGFQSLSIVFFALSSGWICTLSTMYLPATLEKCEEKNRAATVYLLLLLAAMSAGAWMSALLR